MATPYDALIESTAKQNGIDPVLFRRQLYAESRLDPNAPTSPAGAIGIAQFMPGTAAQFHIDPRDPQQAIPAAGRYMAQLKQQFGGNEDMARAAYNWGPGNVQKLQAGTAVLPDETKAYLARINGLPMPDENGGALPGPRTQGAAVAPPPPVASRVNVPSPSDLVAQMGAAAQTAPPVDPNAARMQMLALRRPMTDPLADAFGQVAKAFRGSTI